MHFAQVVAKLTTDIFKPWFRMSVNDAPELRFDNLVTQRLKQKPANWSQVHKQIELILKSRKTMGEMLPWPFEIPPVSTGVGKL